MLSLTYCLFCLLACSLDPFTVSSTLELPISKNDLSTGSYDDSLEDLFNNAMTMPLKVANSRHYYCDIFSRQSVGSSEGGNSSSPDIDDECINFLASIPKHDGCEIIQLIPKKPTAVIPNAMYQPECTNIQKLLKSSCSAFRYISEINKITKSQTDNDEDGEKKEGDVDRKEVVDGASSSSHV